MENIAFRFTASVVDAIEQAKKLPIANVIGDNSIKNLAYIIEKAGVGANDKIGMSNSMAMSQIDEYLAGEKDTDDLVLDITDALIRDGFLSRALNVEEMRELKALRGQQASKELKQAIKELQDDEE